MTDKTKMAAIILAVAFAAYHVTLFALCGFTGHTVAFWTSWMFMLTSFAAMAGAGLLLGEKGMFLRDWLFGYPIVKHSTVYIMVEFCASTLFIIFERQIKWGWAFAAQFLMLCIYGICAVSCFLAKETIDEVHARVSDKTAFWKLLRADADVLVQKCPPSALKAQLQQLSEAIRYSDPMSSEALAEWDKEIAEALADCGKAVSCNDLRQAGELCQKAQLLLTGRNKRCQMLK